MRGLAVRLADWRRQEKLTLKEVAGRLEIAGVNPSRTVQRMETGESWPDAPMLAAIFRMTGGRVTPWTMANTRMEFLLRRELGENADIDGRVRDGFSLAANAAAQAPEPGQ